jgi:hypothetical protein
MPTIPAQVHIDESLEKYINDIKQETGSKILIPYRDWESIRKTQTEYKIPLGACLYRLDNGRIKTKTLSHEKNEGKFNHPVSDAQFCQAFINFIYQKNLAQQGFYQNNLNRTHNKVVATNNLTSV